jgi:HPt (histidine-containing phosphotransfer) domain-containing protein
MVRHAMRSNEDSDVVMLKRELHARDKRVQELSKELEGSARSVLQRELKARDKKLEDLTRQIEALKNIDLEMREKTLPNRPTSRTNSVLKKASP